MWVLSSLRLSRTSRDIPACIAHPLKVPTMHRLKNALVVFLGLYLSATSLQTVRGEDFDFDSLQSGLLETIERFEDQAAAQES